MVCDLLWPLGVSLLTGSIIGIALSPVWFLLIWALIAVEEESMISEYGEVYRVYQSRAPRFFPRLPGAKKGRGTD